MKKEYTTIFYNKITKQFLQYVYKTELGYKTFNAGIHPFEECVLLTIEKYKRFYEICVNEPLLSWNNFNNEQIKNILEDFEYEKIIKK